MIKKIILALGLLLVFSTVAIGQTFPPVTWEEADGSPSTTPVKIIVDNATLTDNADGTVSHSIDGFGTSTYLKLDTSNDPLTNALTAPNYISTAATGTQPYASTSTTLNTNLNADLLDGKHTGTSGNVIPLLDGANTWSADQVTTGDVIFGVDGIAANAEIRMFIENAAEGTLYFGETLSGAGQFKQGLRYNASDNKLYFDSFQSSAAPSFVTSLDRATGNWDYGAANLTTTGTLFGINVTSGADPGHTHTGTSLSLIDISADTNLAVTAPVVLTNDTLSLNTIDISADTNLAVTSPVVLTDDTLSLDFSTNNNWTGTNQFLRIGVGTAPAANRTIVAAETFSGTGANVGSEMVMTQSTANANVIAALSSIVYTTHTTGSSLLPLGYFGGSRPNSNGALTLAYGGLFGAEAQDTFTPTIVTMVGGVGLVDVEDAIVTNAYGVLGEIKIDTGSVENAIGVYALEPGGGTNIWGMLSVGDVQVNSDKKLIFEGSAVSKGDTYLIYDSVGTTLDAFVNNVEIFNMSGTQAEFLKIVKTSGITGDVFAVSTDNTDPTTGGGAATGRIPIDVGGVTKYIAYY